jgi:hypothetical protein
MRSLAAHFLSVIMAADARAERFLLFQASCFCGTLSILDFPGTFFDFFEI